MKLNKTTINRIVQGLQGYLEGQTFTYLSASMSKLGVPKLVTKQQLSAEVIIGTENDEIICNLTDFLLIFREDLQTEFVFSAINGVKIFHNTEAGEKRLTWLKI